MPRALSVMRSPLRGSRARNLEKATKGDKARSRCYGILCYTASMSNRASSDADTVAVEAYVFDTLMHDLIGHDRAASAFVVYLHLWRQSFGVGETTVQMSLRDIAEGTGLSKRGVQEALSVLTRRQLVGIARKTLTDVPVYTVKRPWRR
jgi:hypothetical protein